MAPRKSTGTTKRKTKKADSNAEYKEFNLVDNAIIEEKEEKEESFKTTNFSHFDILKGIFTDKELFDNMTDAVFKQNFFMLNRTLSIKYPQQAQAFNNMSVNTAAATKVWCMYMRAMEGFGKQPSFIYTKGVKATESTEQLDKSIVSDYCRHFHLSQKDFKDMMEFFYNETVESVKEFEKKQKASENGFKKMTKSELSEEND